MSLSREEVFAAWAPPASRWSAWAKPVLFANAGVSAPYDREPELPPAEALAYLRDTAIILDLPESKSVLLGLSLAASGFHPVPLYNATDGAGALVDMDRIARFLPWGAEKLKAKPPRPDAPPVFLLNSERMEHGVGATIPGRFDNRWCIVPQDMPSADFLKAAGIRKVVLVSDKLRDDLAHILYRYRQAEIDMRITSRSNENPVPLNIAKPTSFKSLWYRLGVFAGLRRNAAGGFGAKTPDPGTYSGGYS